VGADRRADTPIPVDTATRVDRAFPAAVDEAIPADNAFRADAITLVATAATRAVGGTLVDAITPAGAVIIVADAVTTADAATTDVAGAAMGIGVAIWDSTQLPTPTGAITARAITPLAIATLPVITIDGVTGSRIQVVPSTPAIPSIRAIQPIRAINLS
jgi:hypothetical protein